MGTAIIRHGRVLAARRTGPDDTRGGWELPGGKVEPGEDPDAAVVREIREELVCTVAVTGRLDGEQTVKPGYRLRVALAELTRMHLLAEPSPGRHAFHDLLRAYAAEQAWKAGIVVVAAGGNYGFQNQMNNLPALADPAFAETDPSRERKLRGLGGCELRPRHRPVALERGLDRVLHPARGSFEQGGILDR